MDTRDREAGEHSDRRVADGEARGLITPNQARASLGLPPIEAHLVEYNSITDTLTFDGFKFSGELMRQFTATPCGQMFRIINRDDGVISVSTEYDPLAVAAPDLLATLIALRDDVQKLKWGQSYPGRNHALMDSVDAIIAQARGLTDAAPAHGKA